jgi:conjugative transfer signal peptidase TraF
MGSSFAEFRPRLVWNLSSSAPKGLYWIEPAARPLVGEFAAARLAPDFERLASDRHYLPQGLPLIKDVSAGPGDEVCARGNAVLVFDQRIAVRQSHDPAGRRMPWWTGCVRLGAGEYLLLNQASNLSFDGRYFGRTSADDMLGRARLLWAS